MLMFKKQRRLMLWSLSVSLAVPWHMRSTCISCWLEGSSKRCYRIDKEARRGAKSIALVQTAGAIYYDLEARSCSGSDAAWLKY